MKPLDNYLLDQLWKLKSFSYLTQVQKQYPDLTIYIFGGAIRDIYNSYFNNITSINDIDVFIDQRKMPALKIEKLKPQIELNELDFFSSNDYFKGLNSDNILDYCNGSDYTINSAYFNLKTGELKYADKFLSHIKSKTLSLMLKGISCLNNTDGNYRLLVTYYKLKDKLGFKGDPKTIEVFKKNNKRYGHQLKNIVHYCKVKNYDPIIAETVINKILINKIN
tara:strand:- start:7104 stop:7769 length:666 start_codon:yes stop_codon:yes gene_type:complete